MRNYQVPDGWSDFAEEWKQWKKSPYYVSNKGRVKRDGEIRAPRDDSRGHYRVNLTYDGKREEPKIHQMVMDLFGPQAVLLSCIRITTDKTIRSPILSGVVDKKTPKMLMTMD